MNKIVEQSKKLVREGFLHIFGSGVLAQVGGLISSMIVIRNLPKAEYGYYVNANNLYSYFAVLIGLGLTNAMLQYCSERVSEQRKNAVYRYSFSRGMLSNLIIMFFVIVLSLLEEMNGQHGIARYLQMLSGLPFAVYLYNYFQVVLRIQLKNKEYSYGNMAYSAAVLLGNIILTALFSIPGLILSMYLANLIGAYVSARPVLRSGFLGDVFQTRKKLTRESSRELLSYAITCALTNLASTILVLLDVTCLDIVIGDSAILADYKVASTIPAAVTFIPSCIITFFYPKLVQAVSVSTECGKNLLCKMLKIYLVINGAVYLGMAIFAPVIIWIVFGDKYMNVLPIFQILSLNYFVYSFRSLLGNVIAAIKKVKVNLILAILSGVINILLNLVLIQTMGSTGAAVATLCVTLFIGVMCAFYLRYYFKRTDSYR